MQVLEELIKLAKDLDAATKRGENMGLTDDEIAFYDALAANSSAVQASSRRRSSPTPRAAVRAKECRMTNLGMSN